MKILQCYVENFGKLHQFSMKFTPDMNVFCHENGWGKTTMITFIKTMFYGLSNSRGNNLDQNERKKYLPWQGGNFGGYMDFIYNDKTYRVTRFFGRTSAADTFNLTNLDTGKDSKDFGTNLGEAIFDLDADSFMRTLLIPQVDVDLTLTPNINGRLVNLIHGTTDQSHYATALKILEDKRRTLSTQTKTGAIEKTQTALNDNAIELDELRQMDAALPELQAQLTQIDQDIVELQTQHAQTMQAIGELNVQPTEPKHKQQRYAVLSLIFGICGVVAIVALILCFGKIIPKSFLPFLIILCFALWGCFSFLITYYFSGSTPTVDTSPELATLQNQSANLQTQINEQMALKTQTAVALQSAADLADRTVALQAERAELTQKLQNMQADLTTVKYAQQFLATAYENMHTQYLLPMQASLQKYLQILSTPDLAHATMTTDLKINVTTNGVDHSTAYYSRGCQNMVDLCLRLALVDALFADKEPPLLIMDDPFVNMDAAKTASALQFMHEFSKTHQIIYFTCHASRM